jgi:hypothetical protein
MHIWRNLPLRLFWYAWSLLDVPAVTYNLEPAERKALANKIRDTMVDPNYVHNVSPKKYTRDVYRLPLLVRVPVMQAANHVYDRIDQLVQQRPLDEDWLWLATQYFRCTRHIKCSFGSNFKMRQGPVADLSVALLFFQYRNYVDTTSKSTRRYCTICA